MARSEESPRVDFAPAADPIWWTVPLEHTLELPVLGVPVRFASNSAYVIGVAEDAFPGRGRAAPDTTGEAEPVRVQIVVHGEVGSDSPQARPVYRSPDGERVMVTAAGSFGVTEPRRREAIAYVTPSLAGDRQTFRYNFVEGLTLGLVTRFDRQPFHAAALVRGEAALLLAGPSGIGKSTLAYAGLRAGYELLAEDMVFLQRRPVERIWGMPRYLHLPEDAGARFPELAGRDAALLANGKRKIAVDVREIGAAASPAATRVGICLLERDGGGPALEALRGADVEAELGGSIEPGFDLFADEFVEGLRRLSRRGAWRLRLGSSPEDALPLLDRMFDGLES